MNLRQARQEDIDSIIPKFKAFFEVSPYKDQTFDTNKVTEVLRTLIEDPNSLVLVDDEEDSLKGVLIAITSIHLFNNNKLATELVWWVDPEHRNKGSAIEWIGAYEYWANLVGCYCSCLQNIADERLDKMYTKAGYTCQEHTYVKVL